LHRHDIVIVGGGLAGLRAAYEAALAGADAAVVSKVHPLRSHSVAAQGGMNAALGNAKGAEDDSWEKHAFDTVKGSDYLADQDAVEMMCREAPRAVIDMEHMGTVFSRLSDGRIAQRPFGGAGFPRTCYAADRTGHNLLHTLYEQVVAKGIKVYEEFFVTRLAVADGRCVGLSAIDIADMSLHGFTAKGVLLATGGYGRLFARSTNALINNGDGAALAYLAGEPLKDMEFVQFHPTTLYGTSILMTEGARGEGGLLLNSAGERFMKDYAPKAMELAPRDIVARAIQKEIDAGRGFEGQYVHLDLTHLGAEKIKERLPGIRQISMDFAGVDPVEKPIPIQPGQHYSMGGVDCDKHGKCPLPGLYTAGEAACVSVHGANRLGGNSLLETAVFGKLVGRTMLSDLPGAPDPPEGPVRQLVEDERGRLEALTGGAKAGGGGKGGERVHSIRDGLKSAMFDHFGVFRDEGSMKAGLEKVRALKERFSRVTVGDGGDTYNISLIHALELEFMLAIAEPVAMGALARKESRGSHDRPDFPSRDDENFLRHSITRLRDGETVLEYSPVTLGRFEVKERVY